MLGEVLKSCKTTERRTGSCILQLFTEVPSQNFEVQHKTGLHFPFNLGWHSIQLDIVC